MTVRQFVVDALLVIGVSFVLFSCLGVAVMRSVFDRLHYTAPAATVGVAAVAVAVVVQERLSASGIKALLVFFLVFVTNPVLTHATARAARIRQFGHWVALDAERVQDDVGAGEP